MGRRSLCNTLTHLPSSLKGGSGGLGERKKEKNPPVLHILVLAVAERHDRLVMHCSLACVAKQQVCQKLLKLYCYLATAGEFRRSN